MERWPGAAVPHGGTGSVLLGRFSVSQPSASRAPTPAGSPGTSLVPRRLVLSAASCPLCAELISVVNFTAACHG